MTAVPVTLLVVAKAPEPGRAKTRLAASVGDQVAAEIAAAALLDTLDAVAATPVAGRVVALTGDLDAAAGSAEIRRRLESFRVVPQRGDDFGERLANAHVDAGTGSGGHPVLQIGMDTPQVTDELLASCATRLLQTQAVLGLARDGGWWVLGLQTPTAAECLRRVPMSQPDTGELTLKALHDNGVDVALVELLSDFDLIDDVATVRDACDSASRFARVTRAAGL
jgi:rSAM/selenodomain-associated transferase 1